MMAVVLGIFTSCQASPEIIWTESKPKPQWVEEIPTEDGYLYFVGSASRANSLERGTHTARHAALSKIAGYLGTEIESQFKMTSTEIDQDVGETLKANTEAFVAKAIAVDSYHKKMTRSEGQSRLELFDVFVMLKYPEQEAEEEFTRRETKDEVTVRAAYNLYQKGIRQESEGRYGQAKRFYQDARTLMAQVRAIVPIERTDVSDSQELTTLLKRHEENATSQLRRVVIWVSEKNKDTLHTPSVMASHLTAVLTKHRFTVVDQEQPSNIQEFYRTVRKEGKATLHSLKNQGAKFLIVGYGNTSYRSQAMNNYVYEARGTLHAIDTSTGDTILTIPIQSRGYDRNEDRAGLNALKEAGATTSEQLVKELLQREND